MKKQLFYLLTLASVAILLSNCSVAEQATSAVTSTADKVEAMVPQEAISITPKGLSKVAPEKVGMSQQFLDMLDGHIEQYIANGSMPGGEFLVARKGQIVYHKSFGHQDVDKTKTYQNGDIYRLASMTKAVTSVSIMQLFEQGKLGLDDPIFYYIPGFKDAQVLDSFNEADSSFTTVPANNPVTIRHLLTHTSGISYGAFNPGKIAAVYTKKGAMGFGLYHDEMNTEQMANTLATVPLVFQPGTQYMYGLNMELLGRIVEVVSGKPLGQYFRDNIFDPLGMDDTHFYLPADLQDRLVPVYSYNEKRELITATDVFQGFRVDYPKKADNKHYAGGGGLSGTAMDYAKFIQALCNGGTYLGKRILGRKAIEVMTSDQLMMLNDKGTGYSKLPGMTYGLGFALKTDQGSAWSAKTPGTYEWGGAFNTKFFIDPEEELIFVGMTQILPFTRPDFWDRMYSVVYGAVN